MPTIEEFQNAIFTGLENACNDAYHFTGEVNARIRPEYIVTVNVAKGLFTMNEGQTGYGYNLIIRFEERTENFAIACVPKMVATNVFDMKFRGYHNTERNGKIDLCIYDEFNRAICPIEIKDFCPSNNEILKYLERNLQLMQLEDKDTGKSTLEFAFLATLEEHEKCITEDAINIGVRKIEEKYQKLLKSFQEKLDDIELLINVRTVAKNLIGVQTNFAGMDEADRDDRLTEMFHFLGVILTLKRKALPPVIN